MAALGKQIAFVHTEQTRMILMIPSEKSNRRTLVVDRK